MNNSDILKFDYMMPVSELPHSFYKLYVTTDYGYDLFGVYKEDKVCKIPGILDQFYYPEYKHFLIIGRKNGGDEVLDGGDIIQETYRHKKGKSK